MIGISFLQVIPNDFAKLESKTTEAESEAVRIFDEFTGKAVEGAWGQCGDRRLRFSSS